MSAAACKEELCRQKLVALLETAAAFKADGVMTDADNRGAAEVYNEAIDHLEPMLIAAGQRVE